MNFEQVIELHEKIEEVLKCFKDDTSYGFNFNIDEFCLLAKFLNPQAYGNRVQCYFANVMDYVIIPSSLDKGDFLNKYNEVVEFKCSFITKFNRDINVKQIRTWQQDVKYYYVFVVDFTDLRDLRYKTYKLTKQEMLKECALLRAKPCHSTKQANQSNLNVEIGFSIKYGSLNQKRWDSMYLLESFDIKKLSQEKIKDIEYKLDLVKQIEQLKLQLNII